MFGSSDMPSDSSGKLSTPRAHNPTLRHENGTNNYNSTALTVYTSTETFLLRFSTHPSFDFDPMVVAHADHIRANPSCYWDYENDVVDEYFDQLSIWRDANPIGIYYGDDLFVEDLNSSYEQEEVHYETDTLVPYRDNPYSTWRGEDHLVEDEESSEELDLIHYQLGTFTLEYEEYDFSPFPDETFPLGLVESYRQFYRKPILRRLYEWHTEPSVGIAEGCFRFFKPRQHVDRPYQQTLRMWFTLKIYGGRISPYQIVHQPGYGNVYTIFKKEWLHDTYRGFKIIELLALQTWYSYVPRDCYATCSVMGLDGIPRDVRFGPEQNQYLEEPDVVVSPMKMIMWTMQLFHDLYYATRLSQYISALSHYQAHMSLDGNHFAKIRDLLTISTANGKTSLDQSPMLPFRDFIEGAQMGRYSLRMLDRMSTAYALLLISPAASMLGIDDPVKIKSAEKKLQKLLPTYEKKGDFIVNSLSLLMMVTERFLQYFYDFPPAFKLSPEYPQEWYRRVIMLKKRFDLRTSANSNQYLIDVNHCLDDGRKLLVLGLARKVENISVLQRMVAELEQLHERCTTEIIQSGHRIQPFAVFAWGGPQTGKTTFFPLLFRLMAHVLDEPCGPEYICERNANDDFWSNYNTTKWAIFCDDINSLQPKHGLDPSVMELLQVNNTTNIATNQAHLDDKGRVPLANKFTYATANTPLVTVEGKESKYNAGGLRDYFRVTGGVVRRFQVALEFYAQEHLKKAPDDFQIDPSKVSFGDEEAFLVNIYGVKVDDSGNAKFVLRKAGQTREQTLDFIRDKAYQHFETANKVHDYNTEVFSRSICIHNRVEGLCSDCKRYPVHGPFTGFDSDFEDDLDFEEDKNGVSPEDRISSNAGRFERAFIRTGYKVFGKGIHAVAEEESKLFFARLYHRIIPPVVSIILVTGLGIILNEVRKHISKKNRQRVLEGDKEPQVAKMVADPGVPPVSVVANGMWDVDEIFDNDDPRSVGLTQTSITNMIKRSLYRVTVEHTDGKYYDVGAALALSAGRVLSMGHYVQSTGIPVHLSRPQDTHAFSLYYPNFDDTKNDLLEIECARPFRDITFAFTDAKYPIQDMILFEYLDGAFVSSQCVGVLRELPHGYYSYTRPNVVNGLKIETETRVNTTHIYVVPGYARKGRCGGVYVNAQTFKIVGTHVAGISGKDGVCVPYKPIRGIDCKAEGVWLVDPPTLGPLHPRSKLAHTDTEHCLVLGTIPGKKMTLKNPIERTSVSYDFEDAYPQYKFAPAAVWHPPERWDLNPYHQSLAPMIEERYEVDINLLIRARMSYISRFQEEYEYVMGTVEEGLNGREGDPYFNRMKFKTSAGYNLPGSKRSYCKLVDEKWVLDPSVWAILSKVIILLKAGVCPRAIYKIVLKIETQKLQKVLDCKSRLFAVAMLIINIIKRMIYMPVISYMSRQEEANEWAVGMNSYGYDWDRLYHRLRLPDKRSFAGDYKKFDKRQSAQVLMSAYFVLICLMMKGGASPEIIIMAWALAFDAIFPVYSLFNDLFVTFGTNPSGDVLTTHINCIVNSLYIRISFYINGHGDFNVSIVLITYGDDNVISVLATTFCFNQCYQGLKAIGVMYTPADKTDPELAPPFDTEITFLKRSFVVEGDEVRAPLEFESMIKAFEWWDPNTPIGRTGYYVAVIRSAVMELAQHTEETFHIHIREWIEIFKRIHLRIKTSRKSILTYVRLPDEEKRKMAHPISIKKNGVLLQGTDIEDPLAGVLLQPKSESGSSHPSFILKSPTDYKVQTEHTMSSKNEDPTSNGTPGGEDAALLTSEVQRVIHYADEALVDKEELVDEITPLGQPPKTVAYSLDEFLSRPIRVYESSWAVGTRKSINIDPTALYLADPLVVQKMANYSLINFKLRYRIQINGSQFHLGRLALGYYPLAGPSVPPDPDNRLTVNDYTILANPLVPDASMARISNLPGFCLLNPSQNTVIEKLCPFFYPLDYLTLPYVATSATAMGRLYGTSTLLKAVNAAAAPVHISIWVSLEDVDIRMPNAESSGSGGVRKVASKSKKLSAKQKAHQDDESTEVAKGTWSSTSSAIADAMGSLSVVPIIGPYASIGSSVAEYASEVFSIFGWSRPITNQYSIVRSAAVGPLAPGSGADIAYKLAVDPNAALAVDASLVHAPQGDGLVLENIYRRWSFIGSVNWDDTAVVGQILFSVPITPMLMVDDTLTPPGVDFQVYTNSAVAAYPFTQWYGSMEVMVLVVSSHFQSGRLQGLYQPTTTAGSYPDNSVYSHVLDLSHQEEGSVGAALEFGWGQPEPYKPIGDPLVINTFNFSECNGQYIVRVVNPLTGPDSPHDVEILIFVRGGKDLHLQAPRKRADVGGMPNVYANSGRYEREFDDVEPTNLVPTNPNSHEKSLISYGERIVSARNLVKRYEYYRTRAQNIAAGGRYISDVVVLNGAPDWPGLQQNGGLDDGGAYNYTTPTPLAWYTLAFAGRRGGYRMKTMMTSYNMEAPYMAATVGSTGGDYQQALVHGVDDEGYFRMHDVGGDSVSYGNAATSQSVNPCLEFDVPMKAPLKFVPIQFTYNGGSSTWPSGQVARVSSLQIASAGARMSQICYLAASEDFDLLWYTGMPTFRGTVAPPIPT